MKTTTKKLSALILSLIMVIASLPITAITAFATSDVEINETNFPDAKLKAHVESFDTDKNGALSSDEIEKVTEMSLNESGITSLKGIEYFTALKSLYFWGNQITSIDVSKNTALEVLICDNNQLTELDLSNNTALTRLDCFNNRLTSLELGKNTALKELHCLGNQLESLDVSKNTALTELSCSDNRLTSLDVSNNTALEELLCFYNQITSLDVSKNTALKNLDCHNNLLTSLDVSQNTALETLNFMSNEIASIDLSKNTALKTLNFKSNQITSIDLSKNTVLEDLDCSWNFLTSLDISKNTALKKLVSECNMFAIEVNEKGTFDLSTLPGNFDVNKASNWEGGSVNGNILTVNKDAEEVTYIYDMGNGKTNTFILMVTKADPESKPDVLVGDVNGDKGIKIADAKWILQNVAKTRELDDTQKAAADLNKDGKVTIVDAKWVLQIVADLRDEATLELK